MKYFFETENWDEGAIRAVSLAALLSIVQVFLVGRTLCLFFVKFGC